MPPKRNRDEADATWAYEQADAAALEVLSTSDLNRFKMQFAAIKSQALSNMSSPQQVKVKTRAATDFSMDETLEAFGLEYERCLKYYWDIEKEVEGKEFPTTPCIQSLLDNYAMNFDFSSSEAICRTAIDLILNECLTVMKGNNVEVEGAAADSRPKTPNPWRNIKVYGEVSFTHKITSQVTAAPSPGLLVSGRVDHGIGRVLKRGKDAAEHRKLSFYSLMLLVEAKILSNVEQALPQLIVYLASLHQSQLQRKCKDATVYGVASDGCIFMFVKISHDRTVTRSNLYDVLGGHLNKVLLFLRHILETTASRSPPSTPAKTAGDNSNNETAEHDPALDVNNNVFLMRQEEEEDEEEHD